MSAAVASRARPSRGSMSGARIDVVFVILDVHITLDNSPVLQTQVGAQILAIAGLGLHPALVCTVEDAARFDAVIGARLAAAGVPVVTVLHRGFLANFRAIVAAVRRLRPRARRAYARTIWGALAIRLATFGRLRYVYDVRGALSDETMSQGSSRWKARLYAWLERSAVRGASHVSAVSRALASHIGARYGIANVAVVPSCVESQPLDESGASRRRMRETLGLPQDAIVFVYSGGLNYYQQVPEMLDLWERLLPDPRVRYLLLTSRTPHVGERAFDVTRFGERLVHRSVPQSQVHGLLASADIGFLLRAPEPLNAVASPVKAAEYLMAGLALAISPGIGDASPVVERYGAGAIVPRDPAAATAALRELVRELAESREAIRARARQAALEHYVWSAHGSVFERFYGSVER